MDNGNTPEEYEVDEHEVNVLTVYARSLATSLAKKFYPEITEWRPTDTLRDLLLQIDNMTAGIPSPLFYRDVVEFWKRQALYGWATALALAILAALAVFGGG